MRVLYTFRKKGRVWIVTCPSDKSADKASYTSLIEAINVFLAEHRDVQYFEVVIPVSTPNALSFSKAIRKTEPKEALPAKEIKVVYLNEWGDSPIPDSTIQFKLGAKWVIAIPPYAKENVLFLKNPLPGTRYFASGKGSTYKTLQVFGNMPDRDININLGWAKVHIFPNGQELGMEFLGGKNAITERWRKEHSMLGRIKSFFDKPR